MEDVINAEEAVTANLGPGLGQCEVGLGFDNITFDNVNLDIKSLDEYLNNNDFLTTLTDDCPLPPPASFAGTCGMETASIKDSTPQPRYHVPPGGPPPPAHMYHQNPTQPHGHNPSHSTAGHNPAGHGGLPAGHNPAGHNGMTQHPHTQKNSHNICHTQFPESPPDSGSEPYSPPNDNQANGDSHQNYKANGTNGIHPQMGYMMGGQNQGLSPPHSQTSPLHHPPPAHHAPAHSLQPKSHTGAHHTGAHAGYMCEPPKLVHPAPSTTPMSLGGENVPTHSMAMLNPHMLPNQHPGVINPNKKRKRSPDQSPNNTLTPGLLSSMGLGPMPSVIKTEPTENHSAYGGLGPDVDEDTYPPYDLPPDGSMFLDGSYQVIKWQAFQPTKWASLLDENGKELSAPSYRVDADKGFNYSTPDDAFVCQKKNHFQVTTHMGLNGKAKLVKAPDGQTRQIDSYHLHFWGVKVESVSQSIKIEQSQSDRSKKSFHPVKVDLTPDQVNKVTVGRLHFSETTANNMRKKGKPNPDQRYFMLVVGLHAHCGQEQVLVAAHCSERIIVRASNPGQFESDVDVPWAKGRTPDSVVHAGRVGINTDTPEEALTVHGNIKVMGQVMQPSDQRAKEGITERDTREQLNNISKLRVVDWAYKNQFAEYAGLSDDERADTGVIAQEVSAVLPDAVRETGDIILPDGERIENFLVVNKDRIYMENVGAVRELCKVTDKLETRIAEIEAMKKKLIKQRDSLRSTASSCKSASTCSTISRNSGLPTSGSKDKKKSSSSHHHHHHRHGRHHRCNSTPEPEPGVCSNRVIQITVIVLVLVMAFCLLAITALYILDRHHKPIPPYALITITTLFVLERQKSTYSSEGDTEVIHGAPNNSSSNSTGTASAPHSYPDRTQGLMDPLVPPRCRRNPSECPVVCCARRETPSPPPKPQDDPGQPGVMGLSTEKPHKPESKGIHHNDILHPDKPEATMSRTSTRPRTSPTTTPDGVPSPEEFIPEMGQDAPQGFPESRGRGRMLPPPYEHVTPPPQYEPNKIKPWSVDVHPLDDDQPLDDIPISYVISPQVINNGGQDQPKVIVKDNNTIKNRRKRDTNDLTAELVIKQINKTLSPYCFDEACRKKQGGNYTYSVPIGAMFPEAFITIDFQLRHLPSTDNITVKLCYEQEDDVCTKPANDQSGTIKATPSMDLSWDLPVGYYFNSLFVLRVAHKNPAIDICGMDVQKVNEDYTEYTLHFYRFCE